MENPVALALGLLSLALIVIVALGKRELSKMAEVADRMPKKEWFDSIQIKIDQFPTLARLEDHFKMGHDHGNLLALHQLKIDSLDADVDDHEQRIRGLEIKKL